MAERPGEQEQEAYQQDRQDHHTGRAADHGPRFRTSADHGGCELRQPAYRRDLPPSDLTALLDDVSGEPCALVSPDPGLPSPIVASSWGVQLKLTAVSDPLLRSFINTYKSGSSAPEPGGECTGGPGTPKG